MLATILSPAPFAETCRIYEDHNRHWKSVLLTERATYLVAYDVGCPRRLRRLAKLVQGYRAEGQKSVAECLLTITDRENLLHMAEQLIDHDADRMHLFRLDPRQTRILLGTAQSFIGGPFIIE